MAAKMAVISKNSNKIKNLFSLKPVGQFHVYFICRVLTLSSFKFVQIRPIRNPRWPPLLKIEKTLKNLLLQNSWTEFNEIWHVASATRVVSSLFK